jgi:LemA protein
MPRLFTRMPHSAPIVVFGIGFAVLFVELKIGLDGGAAVRSTLLAAAIAWFFVGLALRARAWRIVDTPVSKVRAAAVGECEFLGIAQSPSPQAAPGSGIPCAWFHWELQHYVRRGRSSEWRTVEQINFASSFWLTDPTGSVWIEPEGADFDGFEQFILPAPGHAGKWRQVEKRLPDQSPVCVLGPVIPTSDGKLIIASGTDKDADFLISDDSRSTVANRLGRWAWCAIVLGALAAVIGSAVRTHTVSSSFETTTSVSFATRVALLVGTSYLVALWMTWLIRVFNRLVLVRNQAQKAWASIEVQLQRRHDLIENLEVVVTKYASYEQATLVDVTKARGALPTDSEVKAATSVDGGTREQGMKLVALAEAYPQLHADEQFTKLSDQLSDTENRVALAREFYNDAINVMRDRRGTFPYLLMAPFVPVRSLELFGGDPGTAAPLTPSFGSDSRRTA